MQSAPIRNQESYPKKPRTSDNSFPESEQHSGFIQHRSSVKRNSISPERIPSDDDDPPAQSQASAHPDVKLRKANPGKAETEQKPSPA